MCCEGCIIEHKKVTNGVCAERSVRTKSTAQDIYRFVPNIVSDNCDCKIIC